MVSYYYIKKACEPLHIQLGLLEPMVTIVNNYLTPQKDLQGYAGLYDFDMRLLWEKKVTADVEANTYKDIFTIEKPSNLTDVYFVKLELKDQNDKLLSDNFYWLSSGDLRNLSELKSLPLVRLNSSYEIETRGKGEVVRVKVHNPTAKLAFFVHLAVTNRPGGDEILPVFWDDNYFSLLPRESKEVCATFATEELRGVTPIVEVGGWNIRSGYLCTKLQASKEKVKTDEPFTVTATIKNTFIDGSRIELYVDNKVVDSKLLWARARAEREISFTLKLLEPGLHEIKVGTLTTSILVN
jgi:exo-1,4-beta-D-glucosaminidase